MSVTYGNLNFDSICGHTPFVGISDEPIIVGGKYKTLKRILVQGKIIGDINCPNSQTVTSKIRSLLNSVQEDFVPISAGGFSAPLARLESIDMNQPNRFGPADFTANFLAYPSNLSSFGYDVLDPVDNKQIVENNDGTISIIRRVSARGISTSSNPNAINNARNFLNSLNLTVAPKLFFQIGQLTDPPSSLQPRRFVETVNRLEGSVSIDIEFTYRANATNPNVVLNYSIDISYDDKSGIYNATINGNLIGNINSTPELLLTEFKKINIFSLVLSKFRELTGFEYLSKIEEQFSTSDDAENNSINFSYTYISDPNDIKSNIKSDVSYDYVKDIATININGVLTARGSQKNKEALLNSALSSINFYSLATQAFNKSSPSKKPILNKTPVSKNITRRKFEGVTSSIEFSVSFSNEFENTPDLIKFEYTLSATPSIDVYNPVQFLDGGGGIFNMKFFRRGSISIQGTALSANANSAGSIRGLARSKLNSFISSLGGANRVVIEDNITSPLYSDNGYIYNFSISENCETRKFA